MTPAGIAISLTEAEIPTKKGKTFWNRQTIRQILMNPSYKGEWNFKEYIIPMPVIIEPEMWEQAQKILQESIKSWKQKTKRQYLLSGLLICGDCGLTMYGVYAKNWGKHYRGYTCRKSSSTNRVPGCYPHKIINAESLEKIVWEKFKNFFIDPGNILEEIQKNLPKQNELEEELIYIEQQLKDAEKGRESLIEAISLGILELDDKIKKKLLDVKNRKEKLAQKKKILHDNLLAYQQSTYNYSELCSYIASVINNIDDLEFEEKRQLLRSAISQIKVTGRVAANNNIPGELPGVDILIDLRIDEILGLN